MTRKISKNSAERRQKPNREQLQWTHNIRPSRTVQNSSANNKNWLQISRKIKSTTKHVRQLWKRLSMSITGKIACRPLCRANAGLLIRVVGTEVNLGFSPRRSDTLHRWRWNLVWKNRPLHLHWCRGEDIGPQILEISTLCRGVPTPLSDSY